MSGAANRRTTEGPGPAAEVVALTPRSAQRPQGSMNVAKGPGRNGEAREHEGARGADGAAPAKGGRFVAWAPRAEDDRVSDERIADEFGEAFANEVDGADDLRGDFSANYSADFSADLSAGSCADLGTEFHSEAAAHPGRHRRGSSTQPAGAATALAQPPLAAVADDATLATWIARIARQDERALEALYDATSARVHGLVLRITQRASLAEEVLEDTYWQVWRQAPRFDAERGRPITWLLAMARSRAIDTLRREQRFQHEELPEDDVAEAQADGGSAAAPPPQDLLEATRSHAHVHAALASLEPRSRQLVSLAFFRGLTHEEIAEQHGMPLGTVKSLIRRALQQLKRVMEAEHA